MTKLSVELVPASAWYTNVRSNVSRAEWEICKKWARAQSNDTCAACGTKPKRLDCHEVWSYDDTELIQRLDTLVSLCQRCHEVKHIGRASVMGNLERALVHLATVNDWPIEAAGTYVEWAFELHAYRSSEHWSLDISFLERLGITATATDRQVS
jgi:hypothetical protein